MQTTVIWYFEFKHILGSLKVTETVEHDFDFLKFVYVKVLLINKF